MFRSEDRKLGRAPISSSAPSRPARPPPIWRCRRILAHCRRSALVTNC